MAGQRRPQESAVVSRLVTIDQRISRLQRERAALVAAARFEGQTWREIAAALGVSRQAAWEAHRAADAVVRLIQEGSTLTEEEATAISKAALKEVRTARRA